MLLNSFNNAVGNRKTIPYPKFVLGGTHYKPQPQKFCETPKTILFLTELHNLSLGIYVKCTKIGFTTAEIFLIFFPCNSSITLCLFEPQYLQLKISTNP